MYYVYALLSKQNKDLYLGFCQDLRKRFKEHVSGYVKATNKYRPWMLVYYEAYLSKNDATSREQTIKKNHKVKIDLKKQIKNSLIY